MKTKPSVLVTEPLLDGGLPADCVRRLGKSLRKQWKRYVRRLAACQAKLSEGAIHGFRVEARRLLSTVELLGPLVPAKTAAKIHAAIKRHLEVFNDLRDTQVQLPVVLGLRRRFPAAQPFGDWLRRRLRRFGRSARKSLRKVRARRVTRYIEDATAAARAYPKQGVGARGAALLLRSVSGAFDRVVRWQARIDPAIPETIHRTRVAFKKFRYMAEAIEDYRPSRNEEVIEAMHRYQNSMGAVQDADVLCRGFERFLNKGLVEPASGHELANELSRRRQQLIDAYLREAAALLEFWPSPNQRRPNPRRAGARRWRA